MSFIVELWNSVFTPGLTPTLIIATHATFALLVLTLSVFVFLTKSIHLVNLLVISILLWATLTWFINELNKENEKEKEKGKEGHKENKETSSVATSAAVEKSKTSQPVQRKSRKI